MIAVTFARRNCLMMIRCYPPPAGVVVLTGDPPAGRG
jgi:hypothetical protein